MLVEKRGSLRSKKEREMSEQKVRGKRGQGVVGALT